MPDGGLDEPPLSSRRLYILFNSYIVTRRKERRFFSNEAYSRGMREHGEHEGSRGGWRFLEFHVDCDNYSETYTHTYTHTHIHVPFFAKVRNRTSSAKDGLGFSVCDCCGRMMRPRVACRYHNDGSMSESQCWILPVSTFR